MEFDRAAAKQAGYTDEEIDEFLRQQRQATAQPVAGAEPPAPTTQIQQPSSIPSAVATTGLGLAELAVPAAGAYGAYKLGKYGVGKAIDTIADRVAARTPVPTAPVAPTVTPPAVTPPAPAVSPILDAQGRPMVRGPVAPTATPGPMPPGATAGPAPITPPQQPGVLDRASQIVRQLAANRVVQGAARVGGSAAALLMPGNIGQNYPFPQTGPLRGSEINPNTGRPWTQEELAAYQAQYGR
jgi:translation initiation factor IF-2